MLWEKLGPIWSAKKYLNWGAMGTLTPTPVKLKNGVIRVFCGIRDHQGIGRIGYFDIEEENPLKVIGFSSSPVLDIGVPGSFDDNGMLLGDFIEVEGQLRMYYVGFQLGVRAKFLAYGGMAVSNDNGQTFERYSQTPIIDRDDNGLFIRAIHGIKKLDSGSFRVWYSEGASWEMINQKPYPNYSIATLDSPDGLFFEKNAGKPVTIQKDDEYRIGRSRVFSFNDDKHILTFTYGKINGEYQSGYAESNDLESWKRKDDWGLNPGSFLFDSKHLAYPALIKMSNGDIFCFYNGNDMGSDGIGLAKLISY